MCVGGQVKLDRVPEIGLDAETEMAITALIDTCFNGLFEGRSFFAQRHHLRLIWRDGGRIVGHVALGFRAVRLGERLTDIVTVAEVATAPDRRGEGIASRLLAEGIAVAQGSRAEFMLLLGKPELYSRAGFHTVANRFRRVEMEGARTGAVVEAVSPFLMVRPLGDAAWDENALLDLGGAKF